MTTAVTAPDRDPPKLSEKLEQALVEGDLSKLSVQERVQFYNATCESLGINPLTKPFGYIVLNGKLTLYALKACTDQLREKRGVSIGQLREEERDGIFTVYAPATDRSGRTDEDMGAVVVANLKGDNLCNAKMKAVTKAKRRVTLSICGLGMLDETEVVTIRGAQLTNEAATVREPIATPRRVTVVDAHSGEGASASVAPRREGKDDRRDGVVSPDGRDAVRDGVRGGAATDAMGDASHAPGHELFPAASVAADDREDGKITGPLPGCISQAQLNMLMSLCNAKGVDDMTLKNHLGTAFGYESKWQVKKGEELNQLMAWVAENKR